MREPAHRAGGERPSLGVTTPGPGLLGLLLLFGVALLLRMLVADIPLERDEGEYAYIAQRWLSGDVPYRDSFDQKPPAVFVVYALVLSTLGSTPAAIHWGAQLWTLGTLALVVHLGRVWFSSPAGLAAGLLMVLLTVDHALLGNAANTELFALLPLTACMAAALTAAERRTWPWSFTAGACGALAIAFKQVAAPMVLVPILLIASRAKRLPLELGTFALGAITVVLPFAAYFALTGALGALWDATVRYNLSYATDLSAASYRGLLGLQLRATLPSLWPICLFAVLGVVLRIVPGKADAESKRGVLWCTAWLLAALLAVAGGGYFRRHYFLFLAPPLALLAGGGVDASVRRLGRLGRGRWSAPAVASVIVLAAVIHSPWYYLSRNVEEKTRRIYANNPFAESPRVASYLRENSAPADRIFVFGSEPQVLFYAQRRSASRYIYVYPLTATFEGVRERQRSAIEEIRAARPKFIVGVFLANSLLEQPDTPQDLREGLRELVESSYELVAATPFRPDGSTVFATGEPVRRMWARKPLWEAGPPWASFLVWERRSASALPPGP